MRRKIFIYPDAQAHAHDSIPEYIGITPLCKSGIERHFDIVSSQKEADIHYLGQFSCGNRPFNLSSYPLLDNPVYKHVCDIEGDWENKNVPSGLFKSKMSINCAKSEYVSQGAKMFVRPTFSKLLVALGRGEKTVEFSSNVEGKFGFKGQIDPFGTRMKTAQACLRAGVDHDIYFNNKSFSRSTAEEDPVKSYIEGIRNSSFALCPRGVGRDTVRYYEACALGRIPVVVSRIELFCENEYEPFWFKIDKDLTVDQMSIELQKISSISRSEIEHRQKLAYNYFHTLVKEYFSDPTAMFMKWYEKNESFR
jgi:hypothetical protein